MIAAPPAFAGRSSPSARRRRATRGSWARTRRGTAKIVRERREAATPNAHVEASRFFPLLPTMGRGIKIRSG